MKPFQKSVLLFLFSGLIASASLGQTTSNAVNLLAGLPLAFESNEGQSDPQVRFLARGKGYSLFLTPAEAVLSLHSSNSAVVRMRLVDGNRLCRMEGCGKLPGVSNYFSGRNPDKWRSEVQQYSRVRMKDVYPGIDLVYYGNQGQLEYDLVVKPGADPGAIRLNLEGTGKLKVDGGGNLVLRSGDKDLLLKKPVAYQEWGNTRRPVEGRYALLGNGRVAFKTGPYDRAKPLVIDPTVVYSTFLGGNNLDVGYSIAVDSGGNAYVTGYTNSTNFPTSAGAPQTAKASSSSSDAFVTKVNPTGTALVYSTYLGGTQFAEGYGIAVDGSGNAYITGITQDPTFPTTPGAPQSILGSSSGNGFITKINAAGTSIIYSTYLGGTNGEDSGNAIAVDGSGNAYVTGRASSTDFPITPGAPQTVLGKTSGNAFVTEINAAGTNWVYSTFLGGTNGSNWDWGYGIAVDGFGAAYVTGLATSTNFPTTSGAAQTVLGMSSGNAFVTKVASDGTSWVYSSYLGGTTAILSGPDSGAGIAVDGAGSAYVAGMAHSSNFPTVNPIQTYNGGYIDSFLTKVASDGTSWVYSSYLNPTVSSNFAKGVGLDGSGNVYVAIEAADPTSYLTMINPSGSAIVYSTAIGGIGNSDPGGITVDSGGNAYMAGDVITGVFTTTSGAFQTTAQGGSHDAYVVKVSPLNPTPSPTFTQTTPTPTATQANYCGVLDQVITDGSVASILTSGTTVYIGGSFGKVGPKSGPAVGLDPSTGLKQTQWPLLAGNGGATAAVSVVIPDGGGGWYIGGFFSFVNGIPRNYLAHILSNGSLDLNFTPSLNSPLETMALSGSTLYVGGGFTMVGGTARNYLAAVDAGTGALVAGFNPNPNDQVFALAVTGTTLYAGGAFNTVNGGTTRNSLAAFDNTTGTVAPSFNPNMNGWVYSLALSGNTLYAGGQFTMVNGATTRNNVAAVNATTGTVLAGFDPNMNFPVSALLISGSTLYAGGFFSIANGGTTVNGLAAVDAGTGTLVPGFNPNMGLSSQVNALALSGSTLYVGGVFTTVGGTPRNDLAAVDAGTGALAAGFNPNMSNTVYGLASSGGTLYAGGNFIMVNNWVVRHNLAAVDSGSGTVIPGFDPNLNQQMRALALSGSTLYAGGSFTTVNGGTTRNYLAAVDAGTGVVVPGFDANMNAAVIALAQAGTTLYAGGAFTTVNGGTPRNYLASVDAGTGAVVPGFNPNPNQNVWALALSGSTLYAGGAFNTVGGTPRNHLAAVDAGTGAVVAGFNPNVSSATLATVYALDLSGSALYVGGQFTTVGGAPRNHLALVDAGTGALNPAFNPGPNGQAVYAFDYLSGSALYVGGDFTTIGGTPRTSLALLDPVTGAVNPGFNPYLDNFVAALALPNPGTTLYVGGGFECGEHLPIEGYAALCVVPPPSPTPTATNTPTSTPTNSPTVTQTLTTTSTPTNSPTTTPTSTPTNSPTLTITSTPTNSPTITPTLTPTFTITPGYSGPNAPGPGTSFVYPSPATGPVANIAYDMLESGTAKVLVWNESAELVADSTLPQGIGPKKTTINISGWARGVYFYRVILQYDSGNGERLKPGKFLVGWW